MTVHQLNAQSLALDLTWLAPDQDPSARKIRNHPRDLLKIKPTPTCYANIEFPWGTQIAVSTETGAVDHLPAAAWLAAAQKTAILVEELGNKEYWLCAVEDGIVFPAGDIVGDFDRITARITELRGDLAGAQIACYDKLGSFELPNPQPLDFSDLTSGTQPDDAWIVKPLRARKDRKFLYAAAATGLCLVAGYSAWHLHTRSLDQVTPIDTASVDRQRALLEHEKSILETALTQNPGSIVDELSRQISVRPYRAAGWRNTSVEWQSKQITAKWERDHGTYEALAEYLENREFTLDEKTGTVSERFELEAPPPSEINLESYMDAAPTRYAILDALATLPGKWTLAPATEIGTQYRARKSLLTGTATGFSSARAAAEFFYTHPVNVRTISVDLTSRARWRFEGDAYEPAR